MASLALGVAGAAAGFALGGPQGAYWGWMAGAALGGIVSPPAGQNFEGQKLRDLRVQDSAYGNFIPVVYGCARISGNVIWARDLVPVAHTTSTSSKGGGGGSTQTTYTYNATFAVMLCQGPISGIRRVWADGTLIYDTTPGSGIVGAALAGMVVYLGTTTQNPDPTISTYVGAANNPAYRGRAYVVIKNFNITPYGNRIPNLSFEVLTSSSPADTARVVQAYSGGTYTPSFTQGGFAYAPNGILYGIYTVTSGGPVPTGTYFAQVNTSDGSMISPFKIRAGATILGTTPDGRIWTLDGTATSGSPSSHLDLWVPGNWTSTKATNTYTTSQVYAYQPKTASIGGDLWYINGTGSSGGYYIQRVSANEIAVTGEINVFSADSSLASITTDGTYLYLLGTTNIYKIDPSEQIVLVTVTGNDSGASNRSDIMYYNGLVWVIYGNRLTLYDPSDLSVSLATTGFGSSGTNYQFIQLEDGTIAIGTNATGSVLVQFDKNGALLTTSYNTTVRGNNGIVAKNPLTNEVYGYSFTNSSLVQIYSGRLNSSSPTYGSAVSDLLTRCGLASSDYDVTALTNQFPGMLLSSLSPGKSWIDQLAFAGFFDAVERNGKLTFVPRGGNSAVTIPDSDLAACIPGQQVPPLVQIDRSQEVELPKSVAVTYFSQSGSYQQNTQEAKRIITNSVNATTTGLSMVLDDTVARQIAEITLYNQHYERTGYQFQCGPAYYIYEPTDVVTIDGKVMRITKDDRDSGLLIKFTAVAEDSSIYTNTTTGAAAPFPAQTVASLIPTTTLLLDIPQLRDQDQDAGFYIASYGSTGWGGAVIMRSTDAGVTYNTATSVFSAVTAGFATTALGNWGGPNIPDETNSVTVKVYTGALSTITMTQLLQGQNLALIGNELVNFRTATLNSDGTYTLSGLLRGRNGTEWAQPNHAIGDTFVLLTLATVTDLVTNAADLNLSRIYKSVTIGSNIAITPAQSFTNTGVRLKPLSPVNLFVGRNANLDCLLNWTRRARYGAVMRDYVDAALCEASESYDIEIYSSSSYTTLKRTFSGNTTTNVTYTAAQQTTDFGGTQSTVYFIVYQNSAVVGRGYAAKGQG